MQKIAPVKPDGNRRLRGYTLALFFLIALAMFFSGCATTPYTNRSQLVLMDSNEEKTLALQAQQQLTNSEKFETGTARAKRVEKIGKRIAEVAGRDDFEWEFHTIVKDELNAFCLPAGKVYFYTGMLEFLGNDDALVAAVMGHEVAHAIARHGAERSSQNLLVNLGIAAASVAAGVATDSSSGESVGAAGAVLAQLGILLPFSRLHESEADHIGTILMAKAGYDPHKAIAVWEKMKARQGSSGVPGFLSTHPVNEDRIADLEKIMPEALRYYEAAKK